MLPTAIATARASATDLTPTPPTPTSSMWVGAASETHVNVDWPGTIKALSIAVDEAAAATTAENKLVVVDHWLLLWNPGLVQELSSVVYLNPFRGLDLRFMDAAAAGMDEHAGALVCSPEEDEHARVLCRERRAGRSQRSDRETEHLRRYYDEAVWPAFLDNTHRRVCDMLTSSSGNALRPTVRRALGMSLAASELVVARRAQNQASSNVPFPSLVATMADH